MPSLPPELLGPAQIRSEGILEGIIQLLFIAIFFGVPILRGIFRERSRGSTPPAPKAAPRPRPKSGEASGGGELWRQLLEGIEEPPDPERRPRPQDPMGDPQLRPESRVRGTPARRRPEPVDAELKPEPAPRRRPARQRPAPLGVDLRQDDDDKLRADLPSASRPVPSESELEASGGDQNVRRRVLTELDGLDEPRPTAGAIDRASLEDTTLAARVEPSRTMSHLAAAPDDWRRAIVLSEILAPPVALRRPGDGLGPAALR